MTTYQTRKGTNVPIERILLGVIGAVGLLAVMAIAPAALGALGVFGIRGKYNPRYFTNTLYRMKTKGLIEWKKNKNGKMYIHLTTKGKNKYQEYKTKGMYPSFKKRMTKRFWDGKWRIVIFDIPEKYRALRDKVRYELIVFGFVKLQASVWVYPYDCEEFVTLLKAHKQINKHLLYIEANRVEYDKAFRGKFKL